MKNWKKVIGVASAAPSRAQSSLRRSETSSAQMREEDTWYLPLLENEILLIRK